ncbi:glutamine synthetase type III [Sporanaerobium hydrogeniformans]|uniref:Glutamine synthetase type III n=1 Tax=Sporanaerobium hydrogeniformans TaxID=3072179 RepID=A0AC61DC14_9FIRM|nr:glutamine synthetase III [Sporanaerobium hydrogeniformans]PHV70578.1 glutamine synthetase type III [Sporanaerobium hydrogeniformans]
MTAVSEIFGCNVFNETVMQTRLPKNIFKSLKKTMAEGTELEPEVAEVVASAMKDWAIEKGATHFTHWFQPMTGITAEKHDAFISPTADGKIIMEFSGKELIKGEPDASSFPSGGLRATFEARGYTTWDPTAYAFVKDGTLYIPTAFCSYSGEVLDKKTPLLRSMEAINVQAIRILSQLGKSVTRVTTTVGPEQEYFLVDKEMYKKRKDLILTGRTLFGAKPPKGQELEDHYFGNIRTRVSEYMKDLDEELWKLGILAKTKHNEVAPAQHELAPIFGTTNLATDHNQLTMELMKKVAERHGLVCLLHEKPFAGVNGSGKHNNWSISTNTGENLLEPGKSPRENTQFLLFLAAVIKAVDEYADLLRVAVASAGNDHRLGANEAPPAIVSMFLGDELTHILECIERGEIAEETAKCFMETGVTALPRFAKDTTDRNRTSPFAFTGNKFEFRMLGSAASIAGANIVLNTIVAEELEQFANRLEAVADIQAEVMEIIKETVKNHKRIIFNGNNYSEEWVKEATKRGLHNLKTTVEALPTFAYEKSINLFVKHGIFTKAEVESRCEIMLEGYSKTINIEALTMLDMVKREILPVVLSYSKEIFETLKVKQELGFNMSVEKEQAYATKLSNLTESLMSKIDELDKLVLETKNYSDVLDAAKFYREYIFEAMQTLRVVADELETMIPAEKWPFPTYVDLLFYV